MDDAKQEDVELRRRLEPRLAFVVAKRWGVGLVSDIGIAQGGDLAVGVDGRWDFVAPVAFEAGREVDAVREGLGGTSSSQAVAVGRGPLALPA